MGVRAVGRRLRFEAVPAPVCGRGVRHAVGDVTGAHVPRLLAPAWEMGG